MLKTNQSGSLTILFIMHCEKTKQRDSISKEKNYASLNVFVGVASFFPYFSLYLPLQRCELSCCLCNLYFCTTVKICPVQLYCNSLSKPSPLLFCAWNFFVHSQTHAQSKLHLESVSVRALYYLVHTC